MSISHREFNPPLRGGHDPPKAFGCWSVLCLATALSHTFRLSRTCHFTQGVQSSLRGGHEPPKAFCGSHPHCSEPLGLCNVNAMIDPSTGPPYPNTHIATGGVQEEMEVWTVEQEEIGGGKHTGRTVRCLDTGSALRMRLPCECVCLANGSAFEWPIYTAQMRML